MLDDMVGQDDLQASTIQLDRTRMEKALISISCKLGVCYPSLLAMIIRADLHLRCSVRFHFYEYIYTVYTYIVYVM
jgi:hypothetical protein